MENNAEPGAESAIAQPEALDLPPQSPDPRATYKVDRASGFYSRNARRGRRKNGTGSRETKLKRKLLVTRVIMVLAIGICVLLSILLIKAQSQLADTDAESGTLASALNRTQTELDEAKKLIAAQDVELGALIKQRIPGVKTLDLDKLYDVNQGYLKKLSFSESGVGPTKRLAYYAVLKNTGSTPVLPKATILLFDRKGLQTGMAKLTRAAATTPAELDELQPGETRTYSAPMEEIRGDTPRYFMADIQSASVQNN